MEPEEQTIKAFIIKWTDKHVECDCFELQQTRSFDIEPLFENMKLFKGKNISLKMVIVPGTMTCKNHESESNKLVQLWNYYVRGKF